MRNRVRTTLAPAGLSTQGVWLVTAAPARSWRAVRSGAAVLREGCGNRTIVVAAATAALFVLYLLLDLTGGNLTTGDTNLLVSGAGAALDCLGRGELRACSVEGDAVVPPVGIYPLLQYLPALAGTLVGLSAAGVLQLLGVVNLAAFAAALAIPFVALDALRRREARPRAALVSLAVLTGSASYQATAGFGEMLAATTIMAAVAVAYRGRLAWLAPAVLLACLSKETVAPVVVVLCLAAASASGRGVPTRAAVIRIAGGAVAGVSLSLLFNLFRFGTPRNAAYLQPLFRTVPERLPTFAVGEWLSPTSGVAFFWPLATIVLFGGVLYGVRRADWRSAHGRRAGWALLAALAVIGSITALAAWYSPFGWIAYGPRLAVPLLPAGTLAVLLAAPPTGLAALLRRSRVPVKLALAAVACAAAWASTGAHWTSGAAIQALIVAGPGCPAMTEVTIQEDAEEYYRCTTQFMFRTDGAVLKQAATGGGPAAVAGRVLGTVTAASLAYLVLGGRLRQRRGTAAPPA